jgi:hypothetical protein
LIVTSRWRCLRPCVDVVAGDHLGAVLAEREAHRLPIGIARRDDAAPREEQRRRRDPDDACDPPHDRSMFPLG